MKSIVTIKQQKHLEHCFKSMTKLLVFHIKLKGLKKVNTL